MVRPGVAQGPKRSRKKIATIALFRKSILRPADGSILYTRHARRRHYHERFRHRGPLALGLVFLPSLLAGCNSGTTSSAIPASPSHFTTPHANADGIRIWAAAEQTSTVFGLSVSAKRILDVISTESQPVKGGDPLTLKVDHAKDLFVTDLSGGKAGVIQEYKDGRFTRAYSPDCAVSDCSNFTGLLTDTVVDNSHVFAIMERIQYKVGGYTVSGSGYEYWPKGNP